MTDSTTYFDYCHFITTRINRQPQISCFANKM